MNDKIKWPSSFKHGIEEDGKLIPILPANTDVICRAYRQHHGEIKKRVAPTLRAIAKKRKKKEQEDLAKLTKIQEDNAVEKEKDRPIEITSILPPPPSSNRLSSPLPDVVNKSVPVKGIRIWKLLSRLNFFLIEISSTKQDVTKKKKMKQQSTTKQIPK